jgi:hypothetical protein
MLTARTAWFVALAGLALASPCVGSEPSRFEVEVGIGDIEGTGIGSNDVFQRQIEDINDGRRRSLALRWHPAVHWTAEVRYEDQTLRYEDPRNTFCPMSARLLTGYDPCQAATYPRIGEVEDELLSLTALVGWSWQPTEPIGLGISAGIVRAEWQSEGDVEAATLTSCLAENRIPPRPIPGCTPIRDKATEIGWVLEAHADWTLTDWLRLTIGGHWQDFQYRVYRNEAGPRFCEAGDNSGGFGFCNSLDAFLPASAFEDGSWSWWYGEAAWGFAEAWDLALRGEASGSRDWESISLALRYRW